MNNPRPELPPVLLGPDSGRKVAEHIELSGKTGQLPDPRNEAVGLLREIVKYFDHPWHNELIIRRDEKAHGIIRSLLARIDK